MLNRAVEEKIGLILQNYLGKKGLVKVPQAVSGGSINKCYRISFASNHFFLKLNDAALYPQMFLAEASGLRMIAETTRIAVPDVVAYGEVDGEQYLILQWVERGASSKAQSALGFQLAELHKCSNEYYGLHHSNYMGSLVQLNGKFPSINDFFIDRRLRVQVEIAFGKGLIDRRIYNQFELLFNKAVDIIPVEAPALVHGDLWSGNYMISFDGIPYLIDPAIAYSHREVDLAMTRLFGGFDSDFYASYQDSFPLEKDWEKRVNFWNLYPLLIHLNLFGRSYLHEIQNCLKLWV